MLGEFLRRVRESVQSASPPEGEPAASPPVPAERPGGVCSPLVLAYLGDAVWDLHVRLHLVEREGKRRDLTRAASALVSAAAQSRILAALEPELREEEREVVRRGRNANIGQVPKNAAVADYRRATAFECLLGYLLLAGQEERLLEILELSIAAHRTPESPGDAV